MLKIPIHFYSYFKELTGCAETIASVPESTTMETLLADLHRQFPKLAPMKNSTLTAVDVDYQGRDYVLKPGDVVSLFPPVQGG